MKNRVLNKYIGKLAIFTAIFIASALLLSFLFFNVAYELFRGVPSDFDGFHDFAAGMYNFVCYYRKEIVIIAYLIGFLIITIRTVSHLGNLLTLTENAVNDEKSVVFGENCPEELKTFASSVKNYRDRIQINEQARQLAEQQKNDLIMYLAHDLKTPLTSIIGYLGILEESPDLPREQRAKYVGITLDKSYRLEQLINEFFEITRLNLSELSLEKTNVDLSIMLNQLVEEFYPLLEEKRMAISCDIESGIRLNADADKLARALDNLLRNAVNYGWDESEVKLSAHFSGSNIVITLANRGDEIPAEKLARIFDKFCRLDSSRRSKTGGAGLGLAITKQIIELHNGTISAACNGNDITFTIVLPM